MNEIAPHAPMLLRPAGGDAPAVPRFGRMGNTLARTLRPATDNSLFVAENVDKVFIWNFLALDVLGLWLWRILQALLRGRKPYEPDKDPDRFSLSPSQEFCKSLVENVKGLNWPNFMEESGREFCTGPGMLLIPTILAMRARRSLGQSASELPHQVLERLSTGYVEALSATKAHVGEPSRDFQKRVLKDYVASLFPSDIRNTVVDATQIHNTDLAQTLGEKIHLGNYLEDWAHRWSTDVMQSVDRPEVRWGGPVKRFIFGRSLDAETAKKLDVLNEELKQVLVNGYNRQFRQLQQPDTIQEVVFNRLGSTEVPQFAEHLKLWKDYVTEVPHQFEKYSKFVNSSPKGLQKLVAWLPGSKWRLSKRLGVNPAKTAESLYRAINRKKWMFGWGTTLFTGLYVFWLSKKLQSHPTYPANREFNTHTAPPQAPRNAFAAPRPYPQAYTLAGGRA